MLWVRHEAYFEWLKVASLIPVWWHYREETGYESSNFIIEIIIPLMDNQEVEWEWRRKPLSACLG